MYLHGSRLGTYPPRSATEQAGRRKRFSHGWTRMNTGKESEFFIRVHPLLIAFVSRLKCCSSTFENHRAQFITFASEAMKHPLRPAPKLINSLGSTDADFLLARRRIP